MVLLVVCAFFLPYMPGNPPFLTLEYWHLALLTAHVTLAPLLLLKHCWSLRLGLDSLLAKGRLHYRSSNAMAPKYLHLGATTTRST